MADPFQPKFVDLVRNYSTTVGTGNFVLGPAVNGHSSLATALTVGDSFYYSAIGVDKPAEREVGRGVLLADGTISRTPVSGPKTNFTTGNKTIALIAAAEWFTAIQAGGSGATAAAASAEQAATSASEAAASATSANDAATAATAAKTGAETARGGAELAQSGAELAEAGALEAEAGAEAARDAAIAAGGGGGGQASVASRAALAELTDRQAPVLLTESGRDGFLLFDTANLSAKVSADPYQGVYVAPTSDPSGASGAWVRKYQGAIELAWFGVADGAANNAARVESAMSLLSATRGALVRFPHGQIAMDSTVDVTRACIIEGHGPGTSTSGPNSNSATLLIFPPGLNGFRIHNPAQGTIIRQMRIVAASVLATTGTASYTAGSYSITLAAAGDFVNGQTIWLEGAGPSITLADRGFSATSGSAVVTWTVSATDANGATPYLGNSIGYIGQQISVAGAGFPAGTSIVSWGIGTATLSANATATVSGAAATIRGPLVSEIASGGGTTTLALTSEPHAPQSVTNAVVRHAACGIYSSIQCHTADFEAFDFQIGMALCGITIGGSVADCGSYTNSYFFGTRVGALLQGYDAQVNTFYMCNFAGPEVGVMDNSILGNDFVSCHWAFNNGIQVGYTGANVKIIGGYFETGTSWIAHANGQAKAYGTTSIVNGSGFNVLVQGSGETTLGDVLGRTGRFNKGFSSDGAKPAWFSGNINGGSATRFGDTASGWIIGGNGAAGPNYLISQLANGTYCEGHVEGSRLKFGTSYSASNLADMQTTGMTVPALIATGTVTGANLSGTNSGDQIITLTGNITGSGAGSFATTIASGAVTLAMQANMATGSVVYRKSASAGAPEVQTLATLKTDLGLTGTNSGDQFTAMTSARLLGRTTAGAGAPEEIGVADGITLTAGTLGLSDLSPTSVAATGAITSTGGGIGYAAGAGGTVTQTTNKSAAVTLHKLSGRVTMHGASMAAAAIVEFTVNNSQVVVGDTINLNLASGAANGINYRYWISSVGSGLFKIVLENRSSGALAEALVLNFAVLKAVSA